MEWFDFDALARLAQDAPHLGEHGCAGLRRLRGFGTERLAATEAGHRVACTTGAHVVFVHAGPLEPADVRALRDARPGIGGGRPRGGGLQQTTIARSGWRGRPAAS